MATLSSYNPKNKPVIFDSVLICILDSLISFISGIAVWTIVGYMKQSDLTVDQISSIGLVFITYPTAIQKFEQMPNLWAILIGLILFTLGIDTAFTSIECVSTAIRDTTTGSKLPKSFLAFIICITGFLMSSMFCTNWGFVLFDCVDHYISNYLVILIGVF
jgi:neurotransmitter:Na+ symporter, NSS family